MKLFYKMRTNINPKEWGGSAWKFLKSCAEAYDDSCADDFQSFIKLLPSVLPCETCRLHSAEYIASHPLDTGDLVGWLERFRLAVAARNAPAATTSPPKCQKSPRVLLVVIGTLLAMLAVVLLILGFSKLAKV
jgi:hypothetical protein